MRVSISCQLKTNGANTYFLHRSWPASRKRLCQLLFLEYALEDETIPAIATRTIKKKKIGKGGKATRIAEWHSGSERWGAPAVGPRISLPGPSHLCDDSHPPYRPRPDSESLPHDPGTLNRQMPQDDQLGRWREDGAPSSTVPSPSQAACRFHLSPSCKTQVSINHCG